MGTSSKTDRIVSVMATVVALSAVAIALFEAAIEREHQRLSVYPRIELSQNTMGVPEGTSDQIEFQKTIRNAGLGPAILSSYEVTIDGQPVFGWDKAIEILTGNKTAGRGQHGLYEGMIIQAGEEFYVLDARVTADQNALLIQQLHRMEVTACYCSLYEECWTITEFAKPEPVEACVVNTERMWRNE